uniref:Transcription regulator TrmB N-terminal domain-containing protein n=1 Tax=Thermocrinis ruber TaxID=75906 RepID=A0A7C5WZL0_9AQUI
MPLKTKLVEADAVIYFKDVVRDKELRPTLYLLVYIMSEKLEKGSLKFYMTAEEVIKALGISRDTYYRWLKTLMKKGYLTRIDTNYYTLNPQKHPITSSA